MVHTYSRVPLYVIKCDWVLSEDLCGVASIIDHWQLGKDPEKACLSRIAFYFIVRGT